MLSKKIKQALWEAGLGNEYVSQALADEARDHVSENYSNLSEKDTRIAEDIYCDGFYNDEKDKKRLKIED